MSETTEVRVSLCDDPRTQSPRDPFSLLPTVNPTQFPCLVGAFQCASFSYVSAIFDYVGLLRSGKCPNSIFILFDRPQYCYSHCATGNMSSNVPS